MQNDAIEYRLGVGFNRVSSRTAQREGLERPGRFDCDLNTLPIVRTWPSLAPHAEAVERLVLMGAIEDDELRDVLYAHRADCTGYHWR